MPIPSSRRASTHPLVSVDNEKAAYASVKFIANGATPGSQVAILKAYVADNAQQRAEGQSGAFAESKAIKLVARKVPIGKLTKAYIVTKQIFAKHPEIKLLFAANDMMGSRAIKFLQETKRSEVKVAAYDALDEAVAEVKVGRLAVTRSASCRTGFQG